MDHMLVSYKQRDRAVSLESSACQYDWFNPSYGPLSLAVSIRGPLRDLSSLAKAGSGQTQLDLGKITIALFYIDSLTL